MEYHNPKAMSSNPSRVDFWVCSPSVQVKLKPKINHDSVLSVQNIFDGLSKFSGKLLEMYEMILLMLFNSGSISGNKLLQKQD